VHQSPTKKARTAEYHNRRHLCSGTLGQCCIIILVIGRIMIFFSRA
jgi:hypothetical protein